MWFAVAAILSFHAAYLIKNCQILFLVFFYCLARLTNLKTSRLAFYGGLGIGMALYTPHLIFFWKIFQIAAVPLWMILSFWLGLFLLLGWACRTRFSPVCWACALPFVWTGLEYFRSELYYLRFSWMNAGYAFSTSDSLAYFARYGVYGIGFVLMAIAVFFAVFKELNWLGRISGGIFIYVLILFPAFISAPRGQAQKSLRVTGVQLEFPGPAQAILGLDQALKKFPETDLFVLSEYSFMGPIPKLVKDWCRKHHKYLVAGGEDPTSATQYYNTVFVIDPAGEIVFQQAKCVPVQFMKDGLPARSQAVWTSPWGKLGFGVCYDASYTRVTDTLVSEGAQALIFPTMDTQDWGGYQHRLHGRIAPMRAAEYDVPVFRLCSSGISQFVDPTGQVLNSAPYPGQNEIMSAQMQLTDRGRMPPDRWLAEISVGITILLSAWFCFDSAQSRFKNPSVTK